MDLLYFLIFSTPTLLFFFHFVITVDEKSPFIPLDLIILNCDSSSLTTSLDDRKWADDIGSKFGLSGSYNTSITSEALYPLQSVPQVSYMTARISPSQFTYTFPVSPGTKFLHLYFYPASYPGYWNEKRLKVTFIPSSTNSDSYAFVNGIEVVSMPLDIYIRGEDAPVTLVGHPFPFFIEDTTTLETVY
ncbi:hypothetical protein HHK36_029901 [Tetracentron sinense]|uniref:Malectin-like domain-containing protein n=1 Tax=Tetracentron sinense TaxID=13715 RepID=A0A834YEG2_TETSI|nr:hypothetical protein HHK36_029901 [Tetracentron sinense]